MKIIFPANNILETNADLTAIPDAQLTNFKLVYVKQAGVGYQYLSIAEQGVFKPDDHTPDMLGYWKADTANVVESLTTIVKDDHVITVDEVEFNDPTVVNIAESIGKIDSYVVKDIFRNQVLANWETLSYPDKKSLAAYFVFPNDGGAPDPSFNMDDYWSPEEVTINQQILINKNIEAINRRYDAVRTMLRLKLVYKTLEIADARDLFNDIDPLFNLTAKMGPRYFDDLVDYFKSNNGYNGAGFEEKSYFSTELQTEILDIVEFGIYEVPDLFVI